MRNRLTLVLTTVALVAAMAPGAVSAKKPHDGGCCPSRTPRWAYAQIVDDETGRVVSNVPAPIPAWLDGQTHTVTVPVDVLSSHAEGKAGAHTLDVDPIVLELPVAYRRDRDKR